MNMGERPNINRPKLERWLAIRRDRIGRRAGCERLGASIWELPPGAEAVYHYHFGEEELLIMLQGRLRLRGPEGWQQDLEPGDVAAFPVGERGGRQLVNDSDQPATYLMVSEMTSPEVAVYPEAGVIGVFEKASGLPAEDAGLERWFRLDEAVHHPGGDLGGSAEGRSEDGA
jgi:uncharacterized cupin superfamily protein